MSKLGLQIVIGLCAAGLLLLVGLGFLVSKACCGGKSRPKVWICAASISTFTKLLYLLPSHPPPSHSDTPGCS